MTSQIVLKYPEQPCSPEDMQDLSCPNLFLNREINWLDFNAKVLDEALSPQQPLLEQLKFLAIFYNNLDEFFMVRVANILRQYRNGAANGSADRITPAKQLAEIRRRTLLLTSRAQSHWLKSLAPQLLERGVRIVRYTDLSEKQRRFLDGYFRNEITPCSRPRPSTPGTLPHHLHHLPQFHHPAAQPRQGDALRAPEVSQQPLALHLHPAQQGGQDLRLPWASIPTCAVMTSCCWKTSWPSILSCSSPGIRWSAPPCSASPATPTWRSRKTRPTTCWKPCATWWNSAASAMWCAWRSPTRPRASWWTSWRGACACSPSRSTASRGPWAFPSS